MGHDQNQWVDIDNLNSKVRNSELQIQEVAELSRVNHDLLENIESLREENATAYNTLVDVVNEHSITLGRLQKVLDSYANDIEFLQAAQSNARATATATVASQSSEPDRTVAGPSGIQTAVTSRSEPTVITDEIHSGMDTPPPIAESSTTASTSAKTARKRNRKKELQQFQCDRRRGVVNGNDQLCGARFTRIASLQLHYSRVHHENVAPQICEICGLTFNTKQDLGNHKRVSTHTRAKRSSRMKKNGKYFE